MNKKFKNGDIVKTRGDMGSFDLIITHIWNNHYCACRQIMFGRIPYGVRRHFNMEYLEKR